MRSNLFHFIKMQVLSLGQIVWLQLLCVVLYPMFFLSANKGNALANTTVFSTGLIMLAYLILRNFAFNDARCKTKLLFGILPVTPGGIIGARGVVVYLFCLAATPVLMLISNITHFIRPQMFAAIELSILPYGLLFAAALLPIEFLIFNLIEAQKADIIGALAIFPYMGFTALIYRCLAGSLLLVFLLAFAMITNVLCYRLSVKRYRSKE